MKFGIVIEDNKDGTVKVEGACLTKGIAHEDIFKHQTPAVALFQQICSFLEERMSETKEDEC